MLDWREEEKQFIQDKIDNYRKNQAKMPLGFLLSAKQNTKNIEKITEKATQEYRYFKLIKYEAEIQEERKRIDNLINEINDKFDNYLNKQQHIISKNIRPFKMEAKPYYNYSEPTLSNLEIVSILCEPFKISFIQEKVSDDNDTSNK